MKFSLESIVDTYAFIFIIIKCYFLLSIKDSYYIILARLILMFPIHITVTSTRKPSLMQGKGEG